MSNTTVGGLLLVGLYFLPAIVAAVRKHRNENAICVLNILLGWTVLGWIGALIWASTYQPPAEPKPKRVTPPPVEPSPSLLARMSDPTEVRPERSFRDLNPRDFKWVD